MENFGGFDKDINQKQKQLNAGIAATMAAAVIPQNRVLKSLLVSGLQDIAIKAQDLWERFGM